MHLWECSSHKIVELLNNKILRETVQMAAEPFNMEYVKSAGLALCQVKMLYCMRSFMLQIKFKEIKSPVTTKPRRRGQESVFQQVFTKRLL